jgi:pSer/pThr/pTyr-binding forkhead associated (FHA) protein
MARCSQCGTTNREGSVFCQNCGQKLAAAVAEEKPKAPTGPACPSCGTVNNAGMNFCKMCGSSLAVVEAPAAAATAARVVCGACGKQTPTGFAFCQHCGHKLAAAPAPSGPRSAVHDKPATAATMMAEAPSLPTPPAGMPRPAGPTSSHAAPVAPVAQEAFASTMGPGSHAPIVASTLINEGRGSSGALSTVKTSPAPPEPAPARVYASLVVVRRDGSDGESVRITSPVFDVGRSEGGLTFTDDAYLAARHLRLSFEGQNPIARALDAVNGVYVRLRGAVELHPGDYFLVGKEVIRFEPVGMEERDPQLHEHGVRVFGTVPREAWGRLRQLSAAGTTRDVWHLSRPDLVLGREEGDVTFPDDEFMSRRHAAVRRASPRPKLEDLQSSNGTFVRLRGDHVIKNGDLLRLGDQLLRVEI